MVQNTFPDLFGFSLKSIKYAFFSGSKSRLINENDQHRIVYEVCKKMGYTKQPEHKNLNLYSSLFIKYWQYSKKRCQASLLVTVIYCCLRCALSGAEETFPNRRMSQCILCIHKDSLKHFAAHFQCSPYRHLYCSPCHTFQEHYPQ